MKLVLVYPPFCPPTVPPYSITYLQSFLKANSNIQVKCLDLNAKFHRLKFDKLYRGLEKAKGNIVPYSELLEKCSSQGKKVHRDNNQKIFECEEPELFAELIELIMKEKPDAVGFSIVYNSQVHYALALIEELSNAGIICVAGGPAANNLVQEKLLVLKDEVELLKFLANKEKTTNFHELDFSDYPVEDYLSKEMIYPIRSSYGCYHKACAFCTHHNDVPYREIALDEIKRTIQNNGIKNLFFIDDTIPARRLSAIADMLTPLGVKWWCQTRPTEDMLGLFEKLKKSGLVSISFGIESGNQRVLDLMRKGTKVPVINQVLVESHKAGIKNIVFIMFGFPGEDEASIDDTMNLLRTNRQNIDIVSASVFGLQKGSYVYNHLEEFGIFDIREFDSLLGGGLGYKVREGLGKKEAQVMREKFVKELKEMNQLPKIFCLMKEQILFF